MGYAGKIEDKVLAQSLRRKGYSYQEILHHIKVSKDTLSRWCRDISLTDEQNMRLASKRVNGQKKGSIVAAENKRRNRVLRTEKIYLSSKEELGLLTRRELFVAGIALYAGEGDKNDKQLGFANANPLVIQFMMKWLRMFCKIPEERFRGVIWLHEGLDEVEAKDYWSSITGIPNQQFYKTYIAKNKMDSKKIRKNIHQYGVFSIRCSDSSVQRQIMGWISALFDGKISDASCARA